MRLLPSLLLLLAMAMSIATPSHGFNITKILAGHPEFSSFNHYLSVTHLATDINRRLTITVLAVDNAGMSSLLAKHLSLPTLKNVLSLHCLVDYYGAKKLHQLTGGTALSSSFFQATGAAPGTTGFVNITDHRAGHVTFAAQAAADSASPAAFVKSVKEQPYNFSIIQISTALSSPEAEAPAAAPAPVNLTVAMAKSGCKLFADLLTANPDVLTTYESNTESGLTAFCPVDAAVAAFSPKFKNLTAPEQVSLLLYHAEPVYNSIQQLKTGNGLSTTLASEGTKKKKDYTFTVQTKGEDVTLETKVVTAKILKTVADQEPVAVYSINKVLQPHELFKPVVAPAPAPAAPKKGKAKKKKDQSAAASPGGDAAADSPDGSPADDQKAADASAADGGLGGCVLAVAAAFAVMMV